jgi:hypothetical protein
MSVRVWVRRAVLSARSSKARYQALPIGGQERPVSR